MAQQVGGTSGLWHGGLTPLDAIDFRRRSWVPHSGWPIAAEALAPFYPDAARCLHAGAPELFDPAALPPELAADFAGLPFDRALLDNKLVLSPVPPKRFADDAAGWLARTAQARLVHDARAVELLPGGSAAEVGRVLYLLPTARAASSRRATSCSAAAPTRTRA